MTPTRLTRRRLLSGVGGAIAGLLAGCSSDGGGSPAAGATTAPGDGATPETTPTETASMDWRSAELTDVLTDERFTIAGLSGPVVLETFAVWCPICTDQQRELAALGGADLTRVSLDVDPNEDADRVRNHAESYGFDWRYAVAPAPVTQSLIAEFGSGVTVAPSAPVVVVCPDGSATYLDGGGVESAADIRATAGAC